MVILIGVNCLFPAVFFASGDLIYIFNVDIELIYILQWGVDHVIHFPGYQYGLMFLKPFFFFFLNCRAFLFREMFVAWECLCFSQLHARSPRTCRLPHQTVLAQGRGTEEIVGLQGMKVATIPVSVFAFSMFIFRLLVFILYRHAAFVIFFYSIGNKKNV